MPADSQAWTTVKSRRWPIVAGSFAIAAALLMFFVTRGGEAQTAAADPLVTKSATVASEAATPTETEPVAPPNLAPEIMATPTPAMPTKAVAKRAVAPITTPPPAAASATTRRPGTRPATGVKRAARLDPNGTMEAY
jgi:hypothetical protein